jgi:hypothetical protein
MIATIAFLSLLLIAGSGGGGGGGGSPAANSSNTNNAQAQNWQTIDPEKDKELISKYETAEYKNNNILTNIDASKAYAELEKNGKNVGGNDVKIALGIYREVDILGPYDENGNLQAFPGIDPDNISVQSNLSDFNLSLTRADSYIPGAKSLDNISKQFYSFDNDNNPSTPALRQYYYLSSKHDDRTLNAYKKFESLNTANIIAGVKNESALQVTNSHGVAFNSKISQLFVNYSNVSSFKDEFKPQYPYYTNHYFNLIDTNDSNISGDIKTNEFDTLYYASKNNFKIYYHPYNVNVSLTDIQPRNAFFLQNKSNFQQTFENAENKTLFITSTGTISSTPSQAGNSFDHLSELANSKLSNGFYAKNLIFVTPIEKNSSGEIINSSYKSDNSELYRSCQQSSKAYCMAAYNDSSYKYLNNIPGYNGDALGSDINDIKINQNMAQAQVAGAAAVLAGAWPHLTPETIRDILFDTADKPEIARFPSYNFSTEDKDFMVNHIYGRGILNLYNAVSAQGKKSMPSSSSIQAQALDYSLDSTSLRSSPIFGDAFQTNVASQISDAVYLDQYGRDYKASLETKFSNNIQTNSFNLDNFAFNNIKNNSSQLNFGEKSQANFRINIPQYKDSNAKNANGLKFAVTDRSINNKDSIANNSSFAFSFKPTSLDEKVKLGFAFNTDEIANSQARDFSSSGFISQGSSFNANPYQNFLNSTSQNNNSLLNPEVRRFNQAFVQNDLIKNKLAMNFSYTNSFDNNSQNLSLSGKKQNQTLNFGLDIKPNDGSTVSITVGQLKEFDNNVLNSKAYGAFENIGNNKTSFVKVATSQNIADNLNLISSVAEGVSQIQGNNRGVFRNYENVHSRSMSVALQYDGIEKNKFGIAYSEPMRVYKGKVNYDIAVGVDEQANVIRKQGSASLAPKGKQRDYEFYYQHDLDHNSQIRLNMLMQKELNNFKTAPTNYVGYLSYSSNF